MVGTCLDRVEEADALAKLPDAGPRELAESAKAGYAALTNVPI
jgi:hypothetical protein